MTEQITLIAIAAMLLGFIATKAIGGIISEYAKRIWFQKIEPAITTSLNGIRLQTSTSKADSPVASSELAAEVESLRLITEKALLDRDYWHAEAMRLRAELCNQRAA